jgi:hypothetical protein
MKMEIFSLWKDEGKGVWSVIREAQIFNEVHD